MRRMKKTPLFIGFSEYFKYNKLWYPYEYSMEVRENGEFF